MVHNHMTLECADAGDWVVCCREYQKFYVFHEDKGLVYFYTCGSSQIFTSHDYYIFTLIIKML